MAAKSDDFNDISVCEMVSAIQLDEELYNDDGGNDDLIVTSQQMEIAFNTFYLLSECFTAKVLRLVCKFLPCILLKMISNAINSC